MFKSNSIHTYEDARKMARKHLPWMVFDYIDGAAGTGYTEQLNRDTLKDIWFQPRILNNVEHRKISTTLFGAKTDLPFGIAPMGMCNLASPNADKFLAQLSGQHKIPVGVSTVSSTSLEDMFAMSSGQAWFQLYISGALEGSDRLLHRAEKAGYKTLVLTVDVPEVGRRPRELRRGFKMPFKIGPQQFVDFACHPKWSLHQLIRGKPQMANFGADFGEFDRTSSRAAADWSMLEKLRDKWKGNLVVKGVLSAEDAIKLRTIGVNAIQVSSHGGRQLDGSLPAILALNEIRKAIGPDMPLFYDSGIRSGEDIVKAYAMGADFVFLGRPFSYAIAAKGSRGLQEMTSVLAEEVSITLAQIGVCDINSVSSEVISKKSRSYSSSI